MTTKTFTAVILAVLVLSGCQATNTERRAAGGTAIGAASGAIFGAIGGNAGVGAAVGAGVGLIGGLIYDSDQKSKERAARDYYGARPGLGAIRADRDR